MESIQQQQQQVCSKCKLSLSLDKYSNPTKEKRCRECVKSAKFSLVKKDKVIDTDDTDLDNTDLQGGKYSGTIFQRSNDNNAWIACVKGHQKRFTASQYGTLEMAKNQADAYRKKLSDDLFETKNKYKIVKEDGEPKYIIVQLSQNYCSLMDYEQLDFVKNNNLFVSFSGSTNAKKYCYYGLPKMYSFHRYVLNLDESDTNIVDHKNRYPLDNRLVNLRAVSHSENNKNKSCINNIQYKNIENLIHATIFYRTNPGKPQLTVSETFNDIQSAQNWVKKTCQEIDCPLEPEYKKLALEYEQIMSVYAKGFKYTDFDYSLNEGIDKILDEKTKQVSSDISIVEYKKRIYEKFVDEYLHSTEQRTDFVITKEVLTSDRKIHHLTHNSQTFKYCSKCDKWLLISMYYKNCKNYDGLDRRCKLCKKSENHIQSTEHGHSSSVIESDNQDEVESDSNTQNVIESDNQKQANENMTDSNSNQIEKALPQRSVTLLSFSELDTDRQDGQFQSIETNQIQHIEKLNQNKMDEITKQKISRGMILYSQTPQGKENKKISHSKRSETMANQREMIRKDLIEKKCTKCTLVKKVSEFGKKSDTRDGYQPYCRNCVSIAKKKINK